MGSSATDEHLAANLLFDYPGANIILRSQDSHDFRVPKTYIINSFPVLGEHITSTLGSPRTAEKADVSLPVVELPESSEILYCLLTFVFPFPPFLPSTPEKIMKLLSVAQIYGMGDVLIHIRRTIAQENPLPTTRLEPSLRIYALAQKYGLRQEALQAARAISNHSISIEDLSDKLHIVPGASLYALWKYYEKVRAILASRLTEFRIYGARGTMAGLRCQEYSASHIPKWVDLYIESVGKAPNLFDLFEFNSAMARHIGTLENGSRGICECASIPSQTIREFWAALASVVHGSFERAELALVLLRKRTHGKGRATSPSRLKPFDVPGADFIIQSSDNVNFRVHKPVLTISSPFFKDLLSLPQPSDTETIDGLPMVQFPEDSELLNCLVSMLYHLPVILSSYDKVLHLLAACQKYEMDSIQSLIRIKVKSQEFPAPKGTDCFAAYAIASSNGLIPEMENAARQTLDHPMTFEVLGEGLRLFEGWALHNLANFRKRCRDNLSACFDSYSGTLDGCPRKWLAPDAPDLPWWLYQLLSRIGEDLKLQGFTHSLDIHSRIYEEYLESLSAHLHCRTCLEIHATQGSEFWVVIKRKLMQTRDKVSVMPPKGACT